MGSQPGNERRQLWLETLQSFDHTMRYGRCAAFVNGSGRFFGVSSLPTSSWSQQICASESPSSHLSWMWEQDGAKPRREIWLFSEGDFNFVIGLCLHCVLQKRRKLNLSMKQDLRDIWRVWGKALPDFLWRLSSKRRNWTKTMACPPWFLSALQRQGENIPYVEWKLWLIGLCGHRQFLLWTVPE